MTSRVFFRASMVAMGVSAALGANSAWAQAADPEAATEDMGVITVTGSRTITDNALSPTPLTSVDIAELARTTPSDTADALNKLPSIMGGRTPRTQGNGSTNNGGNTLSLRNFGASRTLVLLDGHRVAPSNQDGSVNIDVLPQMLVKRVDIVTGGASAIYGSDAVAGVVNYVLDKDFTGLYAEGRLRHVEVQRWRRSTSSARPGARPCSAIAAISKWPPASRHQDMIPQHERPYGEDGQAWLLTGNGSAARTRRQAFEFTPYSRVFNSGPNGNVQCGTALRLQQLHLRCGWQPGPDGSWHAERQRRRGIGR